VKELLQEIFVLGPSNITAVLHSSVSLPASVASVECISNMLKQVNNQL
jgi:hypothetical protein